MLRGEWREDQQVWPDQVHQPCLKLGGLWLLASPCCPGFAGGLPCIPLSAYSRPRALQHPGDHGLGTRVLSALPAPNSGTGGAGLTSSPFPSVEGAPGGFQAVRGTCPWGRACNHLPVLPTGLHHLPTAGRRPPAVLGGRWGKGTSEAGAGSAAAPAGAPTSSETTYSCKHHGAGLRSVGRG